MSENIIILLLFVFICISIYLFLKNSKLNTSLINKNNELENKINEINLKEFALSNQNSNLIQANRNIESLKLENNAIKEKNNSLNQNLEISKINLENEIRKYELEFEFLKNSNEKEKQAFQELSMQKIEAMKDEFKVLANNILKERVNEFDTTGGKHISSIVDPLKAQLAKVETNINDAKIRSAEDKASIESAIKELIKQTQSIGNDANSLAKALKSENKTQGNWGEFILDEILKSSGLKAGIHYEKQTAVYDNNGKTMKNDSTGGKMITDVVVHYPDGKDVVIDSKVSLTAFSDYINSEDKITKQEYLIRHITSIRNHVKELYKKDYPSHLKLSNINTVDYTIMFVPNEGGYQLALQNAPTLWNEAFEKRIIIVSQFNLLALLRMIDLTWVHSEQEKNQEKILFNTGILLDRVNEFLKQYEDVGNKIDNLNITYLKSRGKLTGEDGQHSVIKKAEEIQRLGVKTKKQIPNSLLKE